MNVGKFPAEFNHAEVIFCPVKVGPRHDIEIADNILIEGLVHVPKE